MLNSQSYRLISDGTIGKEKEDLRFMVMSLFILDFHSFLIFFMNENTDNKSINLLFSFLFLIGYEIY